MTGTKKTKTALIRVSTWTEEKLKKIKAEEGHTSLDSVIKVLLHGRGDGE